jgi:hypothetical protein
MMPRYKQPPVWRPEQGEKRKTPRPPWVVFLIGAGGTVLAWLACFAVGGIFWGLAIAFGCHPNEASDGGCPVLGPLAIVPMMFAAFGTPLFILAFVICLVGAALAALFGGAK